MDLRSYLEIISTANVGAPSNYVGTRVKRFGNSSDSFNTDVPGKKKKKKKKSKLDRYFPIQSRKIPSLGRSGSFIMTPQ